MVKQVLFPKKFTVLDAITINLIHDGKLQNQLTHYSNALHGKIKINLCFKKSVHSFYKGGKSESFLQQCN